MQFILCLTVFFLGLVSTNAFTNTFNSTEPNETDRCLTDLMCSSNQACVRGYCQCKFGYIPSRSGGCLLLTCFSSSKTLPFANPNNECSQQFGPNSYCRDGACACEDLFAVNDATQQCRFDPTHSSIHSETKAVLALAPLLVVFVLATALSTCCCFCHRRHVPEKLDHEPEKESKPLKHEEARAQPVQASYATLPVQSHVVHMAAPVVHQQLMPPVQVYQYHQCPMPSPVYQQPIVYQQPQYFPGIASPYAYAPLQPQPQPMIAPAQYAPMHTVSMQQQMSSPPPYQNQETAPIYPTAPIVEQQAPELPEKI